MKCPHCSVDLTMAERHGVEIDYCPRCRGVWLDRGELDKIIDRAEREDEGHSRPDERPYQDRPDDHDRYRGQPRRKSFWHELFD